ncbi:MAG: hypothetical protein IJV94_02505 [Bacilli bacterium]|nr:hypothetical protein [Bacilli bacterium]
MKYILNEIELHPSLNEQDLVKLIYQRTYGPKHILFDIDKSKKYLIEEVKNLPFEKYGTFEISNDLLRVDLHEVNDIEDFFDCLLTTGKSIIGTKEEYEQEIELLIDCIKTNNLNFDIDLIKQLASHNAPVHHSYEYNKNYLPHYRIIRKDLYMHLSRKD